MPTIVQQMKTEGRTDDAILEKIAEMHNESVVKYGNKSRVGYLLDSENKKLLDYQRKL